MDQRSERIGGWAALAAGALSVVLVALVSLAHPSEHARAVGGGAVRIDYSPFVVAALVATRTAFAAAVALSVLGLHRAFASRSIVIRVGSAAGWLAGAMIAASAIVAPLFAPPAIPAWVNLVSYWAPLPFGIWLLCASALAWKLDRLPRWLRVLATVMGALSFMQPAIPELGFLVLLLGLAFWFGLGATLLRGGRFPHPASASDSGADR